VYLASPYGAFGYPYAAYAAYPSAYSLYYRWVPLSPVALRHTDDDTAPPIV
jgi:hypothetical protein